MIEAEKVAGVGIEINAGHLDPGQHHADFRPAGAVVNFSDMVLAFPVGQIDPFVDAVGIKVEDWPVPARHELRQGVDDIPDQAPVFFFARRAVELEQAVPARGTEPRRGVAVLDVRIDRARGSHLQFPERAFRREPVIVGHAPGRQVVGGETGRFQQFRFAGIFPDGHDRFQQGIRGFRIRSLERVADPAVDVALLKIVADIIRDAFFRGPQIFRLTEEIRGIGQPGDCRDPARSAADGQFPGHGVEQIAELTVFFPEGGKRVGEFPQAVDPCRGKVFSPAAEPQHLARDDGKSVGILPDQRAGDHGRIGIRDKFSVACGGHEKTARLLGAVKQDGEFAPGVFALDRIAFQQQILGLHAAADPADLELRVHAYVRGGIVAVFLFPVFAFQPAAQQFDRPGIREDVRQFSRFDHPVAQLKRLAEKFPQGSAVLNRLEQFEGDDRAFLESERRIVCGFRSVVACPELAVHGRADPEFQGGRAGRFGQRIAVIAGLAALSGQEPAGLFPVGAVEAHSGEGIFTRKMADDASAAGFQMLDDPGQLRRVRVQVIRRQLRRIHPVAVGDMDPVPAVDRGREQQIVFERPVPDADLHGGEQGAAAGKDRQFDPPVFPGNRGYLKSGLADRDRSAFALFREQGDRRRPLVGFQFEFILHGGARAEFHRRAAFLCFDRSFQAERELAKTDYEFIGRNVFPPLGLLKSGRGIIASKSAAGQGTRRKRRTSEEKNIEST